MKENWILQSQALSKTSGMDSTTGKSLPLYKSSGLSIQDGQRKSWYSRAHMYNLPAPPPNYLFPQMDMNVK